MTAKRYTVRYIAWYNHQRTPVVTLADFNYVRPAREFALAKSNDPLVTDVRLIMRGQAKIEYYYQGNRQ